MIERISPLHFKNGKHGTYIQIENIKKQWNKTNIREIYRSLQALTSPFDSDDNFIVDFSVNEAGIIDNLFDPLSLSDINLWHFKCDIISNETDKNKAQIGNFEYHFNPYKKMDLTKIEKRIITQDNKYIEKDKFLSYPRKEIKTNGYKDISYKHNSLNGIGSFSFEGYIFDLDKKTLDQSNITDRAGLRNYLKENGGIRVYRENLRVYDYGEQENDWLELDKSRINDPTNSIGNNQILAAVNLNMKTSKKLIEKTNREGFVENQTYHNFKNIVKLALDKITFLRNEDKDKIR